MEYTVADTVVTWVVKPYGIKFDPETANDDELLDTKQTTKIAIDDLALKIRHSNACTSSNSFTRMCN